MARSQQWTPYQGHLQLKLLEDPVSLHKYFYANSNPVSYNDPTGYMAAGAGVIIIQGELGPVKAQKDRSDMTIFIKLKLKLKTFAIWAILHRVQIMLVGLLLIVGRSVVAGGFKMPGDIQREIEENINDIKKIIEQMDRLIISTIMSAAKSVYWQAWRSFVGKFSYVQIGLPILINEATSRLARGESIFASNAIMAYTACLTAGGGMPPEPCTDLDGEIHGQAGLAGFWPHFHPAGRPGDAHAWYLFPGVM